MRVYSDAPPKKQGVIRRNLTLFLSFWFGMTMVAIVHAYVLGWGAFLFASKRDVWEITDMWSVPLGLINAAFRISPEKSFVAVLGILVANSYFYALALTLIFKFVHGIIQRNRVTQLSLSGKSVGDDDDDGL
ncbi:MAG TPA: hypothetical protein VJA94_14810 [Candidatus Angelobacter sp.]